MYENEKIKLRRAPYWSPGFLIFIVFFLIPLEIGLLGGAMQCGIGRVPKGTLLLVGSLVGPLLLTLLVRWLTRPRVVPPMEFLDEHAILPRSSYARRFVEVPYREIHSIEQTGSGRREKIIVSTRSRRMDYLVRSFIDTDGVERLRSELLAKIAEQPDGQSHLARMDQLEALGRILAIRHPLITGALLASIVLAFAAQFFFGGFDRIFGLIPLGANAHVLVRQGQLDRLVTSNFLHINMVHLLLNGLVLAFFGAWLERLIGHVPFLLIYALSALAGASASTLVEFKVFSVGASAALYGLLGALAILHRRFMDEMPGPYRWPRSWWICLLLLCLLSNAPVMIVDVTAHLGGFLSGSLLAILLFRAMGPAGIVTAAARQVRVLTIGLVVLCLACLTIGAKRAATRDVQDEIAVAKCFARATRSSPRDLNEVAWAYVKDPDLTSGQLEVALEAAKRAVEEKPSFENYLDTLATAYYRLGRYDEAVETQRRTLEKKATKFTASQLVRFLRTQQEVEGCETLGNVSVDSVILGLESLDVPGEGGRAVLVELREPFENGLALYAYVMDGEQTKGLFWVQWGPHPDRRYRFSKKESDLFQKWPDSVWFKIALIDASGCDRKDGSWKWVYRSMDPKVESLP